MDFDGDRYIIADPSIKNGVIGEIMPFFKPVILKNNS